MNIDERIKLMAKNIVRQVNEESGYALNDIKRKLEQTTGIANHLAKNNKKR